MLHEETEEKFFSAVNATASAISPDHKWILFTADTTGWDQIYVMPTSGGTPVQITKALGDHWRATWSHDSKRIAWDTDTQEKPGDRQIEYATIGDSPATATITTVTSGNGTNTSAQWSPDDARILFQHTDPMNSVTWPRPRPTRKRLPHLVDAGDDRSHHFRGAAVGALRARRQAGARVTLRAQESRPHEDASNDCLDSSDGVNQNYDGFHRPQ